ncbi:MAG: hypothetical protein JW841_14620, partial [Deltaproteobacteria bacterium]|nr:hypothetical protein [Deltaproteobacteria bacterium]
MLVANYLHPLRIFFFVRLFLFSFIFLLISPRSAFADIDETLVGLEAVAEYSTATQFGTDATLHLGLNDVASLHGWLGGRYLDNKQFDKNLDAGIGLTFAFDVLAWVPELTFGVGLRTSFEHSKADVRAALILRRYLSVDWSLTMGGGGGWLSSNNFYSFAK